MYKKADLCITDGQTDTQMINEKCYYPVTGYKNICKSSGLFTTNYVYLYCTLKGKINVGEDCI